LIPASAQPISICIEYASEHGARVINLSWGGSALSETLSNAMVGRPGRP
jgi:hypothetical protein